MWYLRPIPVTTTSSTSFDLGFYVGREENLLLGKFLTLFFLRSHFIPGGHQIFGMAGYKVDLPPSP
jgi:hypothetical protein